jgi:predicted dehydrogenase
VAELIVVDPDARARNAIRAAFPHAIAVQTLGEALARVDAVVVSTPPMHHAAIALEALRAGKHVLVEKPLATTLADARLLASEAARLGRILMVGHTFQFNAAVQELRRRMNEGELGDILYIHSARLSLGLYRTDVNVVWDLAPHDISIMNFLLDSTPSGVRAWGSSNLAEGVADLAYFQLEYAERRVTGYGHVSWLDPRKVRQVTVVGSRRMAVYDDLADEKLRIFDRGVEGGVNGTADHQLPVSYRYGDIISPHIKFQEPLLLEDKHFVECVVTDSCVLSDGSSGLAVVSVLDAIDRALAAGSRVDLHAPPLAPLGVLATA